MKRNHHPRQFSRGCDLEMSLSSLKLGNCSHKFGRISDVAKTVLILPHSNAGEERVFSLIRKNKTAFQGRRSRGSGGGGA